MPSHKPTIWTIYPDDFDTIDAYNAMDWCVYVERRLQPDLETYKYVVSNQVASKGFVFTRTGKKIYDTALQRQWTRFDSFEEALAIAYQVVNTNGPMGMTIEQMQEHWEKRRKERETQ